MFRGELNVIEEPKEDGKSEIRMHKRYMRWAFQKILDRILCERNCKGYGGVQQDEKNMFLPISDTQTVTGDDTRPQGMPGRVPPNSGRRSVSPRGTGVTPLQPPSPQPGCGLFPCHVSYFLYLFFEFWPDWIRFDV